jgi:hypothetical protein
MAAGRSAAYFDNSPFYGIASTSAEILQQLRYALGFLEIPFELEPLLTGYRDLAPNLTFELAHDLIFVEITGRRVLSFDGIVLQPSSMGFYFAERSSLGEALTRFWGADSLQSRLKYLAQDPAFEDATAEERRLLTEARTDVLTDDDITIDLRRMHALVGNRLVIVTPAIDESAPETVRKAAAEMIAALRSAGGQLGLQVFDPTGPLADFRAEHGFGNSTADAPLLAAAFESYLAGVLVEDFLTPLRQAGFLADAVRPAEPEPSLPAGGLLADVKRLFLRWATGRSAEPVAEPRPREPDAEPATADILIETRRAAWRGDWRLVAALAGPECDNDNPDVDFRLTVATAFWYSGDKKAALALWQKTMSSAIEPLRAVEAAELAFQSDRPDLGLTWCCAAAERSPAAAVAALRLLDAHGRHDEVQPLLDRIAAQEGVLPALAPQLPATGKLRTAVVEYALLNGRIDPETPLAKALIQQWLNVLGQNFREGRLDDMRRTMARFEPLPPDHPVRQSANQYLTRALIRKLREPDATRTPAELESCAREILTINPGHPEATMTLARVLDLRGERGEALAVLEELTRAHPAVVAIQFGAITQWLAWGEVEAAAAAYRRCQAACGSFEATAELKKRLCAGIEREERTARAASLFARAEDMRRILSELNDRANAA